MTLTAERARELLDYDKETGGFSWRHRPRSAFDSDYDCNMWNGRFAGRVAGSDTVDGYIRVTICGNSYAAHRLAWLHTHGRWPEALIDHINGQKRDNSLVNLREASREINAQNVWVPCKTSKSGMRGVSWWSSKNKWRATIFADGKCQYIGIYATKEAAQSAYLSAKQRLHEGAAAATEAKPPREPNVSPSRNRTRVSTPLST